ncbi:fluoride efflux transporter CrcB [Nocardioides sp.]|uniref:fluoride efflux transporter CrcB n=1 Tax=Nocardioides sp. TaxID=35761 RepID=UPI001A35CED1|nr:fluoride efflux transporter CrcB [Nocardioides sp.]MBJ7357160.1 fluoride efflux transporter CrcB [Nocardioides sp.]
MTGLLWVCLGAALGAPGRYLVDRAVQARHDSVMPWGTMLVNVVGSFALGVLTGLSTSHEVPDAVSLTLGMGLCGALTTYSTFGYEMFRLLEDGARRSAVLNAGISLVAGVGFAALGYALGVAL